VARRSAGSRGALFNGLATYFWAFFFWAPPSGHNLSDPDSTISKSNKYIFSTTIDRVVNLHNLQKDFAFVGLSAAKTIQKWFRAQRAQKPSNLANRRFARLIGFWEETTKSW